MKRYVLACTALGLVSLLSGCCCAPLNSCGYRGCVPTGESWGYDSFDTYGGYSSYGGVVSGGPVGGGSCNCSQGGDGFSLPPEGASYPSQPAMPYGTYYGPTTVGPEIMGSPQYVPNGTEWQQSNPMPVTPAPAPAPPMGTGPSALMAPSPIPAISNGPMAPSSSTSYQSGPMVPPPPAEPISQMRFRQYR